MSTTSFGASSTADDVLGETDLRGRRILVTGASSGIGAEITRALAMHGADIVGLVQDPASAEIRAASIEDAAKAHGGSYRVQPLDLADLKSVRACADQLLELGVAFDVVIANAGVMATPFSHTKDGFETQFGINHLGHFVLINRIAPLISNGGRVVMVASAGHWYADVDLDDPNFERTEYQPFIAYGRSKTANILFAVGFDMRHRHRGVRATAVHPGAVQTGLTRYMDPAAIESQIAALNDRNARSGRPPFTWKTIPQGAATSVWAAVVADGDAVGGHYCEDCHVAGIVTDANVTTSTTGGVRAYALDTARAEALWTLSERMVGDKF